MTKIEKKVLKEIWYITKMSGHGFTKPSEEAAGNLAKIRVLLNVLDINDDEVIEKTIKVSPERSGKL